MRIRIMIADDHTIVRSGLIALLKSEPGIEVVGEASSGREVLDTAIILNPDVIVMDISMGDMSGLEVTRRLEEQHTGIHVLILTVHLDKGMLQEAIHNGASGYLPKSAKKEDLVNAIYAVNRGELYIHPTMTRLLLAINSEKRSSRVTPMSPLTNREKEIVKLIVHGYTNTQVAGLLCISESTVEFHRKNLMNKLNLADRVSLVKFAKENGLI